PLLLKPFFSPRPWGSRDLSPIYSEFPGKDGERIGESWLTGDQCVVANGPLAGKTLDQLAKQYGRDLVGDTAPQADRYPLLMKFLFPTDTLSVQVHPDDDGAQKLGQPVGKTECWYVLDAKPGAKIGLGLKPGATREQLKRAIEDKTAENLLNWINVRQGEMYYVDAGTVHAIAAGSILVETQQNSDTTFRLYDYGRPRELHVEQGIAATKEITNAGKVLDAKPPVLVASPFFVVEKFSLKKNQLFELTANTASQSLVAVAGGGVIEAPGVAPVSFTRGEAVVIPASVKSAHVRPQWEVEFIRSTVPAEKLPVPRTLLVSGAEAHV
ncbi:MAG TPA: type I phosphomannose isomerase catalytic subunit, partial [Terriglobales bacterium]|nr:type I phosphomannose isomerase catalytic subunit [Terriglobales bacterium]